MKKHFNTIFFLAGDDDNDDARGKNNGQSAVPANESTLLMPPSLSNPLSS